MRPYCSQVFRQARLGDRIEKSVRSSEFTFPGDPMRLDYSHRRNGTRGFIQSLSVTRAPADAKLLAYTAESIDRKSTRLNSSHGYISYAVFCLKKKDSRR